MARKGRFSYGDAEKASILITKSLDGYKRLCLCGSFRRECKTVGDLDFVVVPADLEILKSSIKSLAEEVLTDGNKSCRIILKGGIPIQVDFMIVGDDYFDSAVLHSTGSKVFNIKCRVRAKEMGFRLSQYGLLDSEGKKVANTEVDILRAVGLVDHLSPVRRNLL